MQKKFLTRIEDVMSFDGLMKTVCDYDLSLIACTDTHTKTLKKCIE